MNVRRIEAAGRLVQLKIGETDLSVGDAREFSRRVGLAMLKAYDCS